MAGTSCVVLSDESDSDGTIINEPIGDVLITDSLDDTSEDVPSVPCYNSDLCDVLPFSQDDNLQDTLDITPPSNIMDNLHEIKTVFRKKVLPSGEVQYYVSWRHSPAKKHRCWVSRDDLSPQLKAFVDSKKIPTLNEKINAISNVIVNTKKINKNDDYLSYKVTECGMS